MQVYVNPRINADVYLKNPLEFDLGKKIIGHSVHMIDSIGFEKFNFKKLGVEIKSTEASIYRYFPNKQRLLIYLSAWYWELLNYHINVKTEEIDDPLKKLKIAIRTMVNIPEESQSNCFLEMGKLQQIVIEQFYKIVRNKKISDQNESGYFESYKKLVARFASIFLEIDQSFKFPKTMANAIIEMALSNHFCCNNLPSLTEIKCGGNQKDQIEEMINYFCSRMLHKC